MKHPCWRDVLPLSVLLVGFLACETNDNTTSPYGPSTAGSGGADAGETGTGGGAAGEAGAGNAGTGGGTAGSAGSSGSGGGAGTGTALFSKPQAWTKDVSTMAKATRSDDIISALNTLGGWGNGNYFQVDFAFALLTANSSTPRKTVSGVSGYCYGGPDCDAVPLQMPIPVIGNTEGSADYVCDNTKNDCHVLVIETSERKLYELYNSTQSGNGFVALGAFVWDLDKQYTDALRGEQCTSADAAGLPIAALLPTADQVASGDIGHAIRFILPNPRMKAKVYVHPATHAGAPTATNANAPPYGVRFRLKASFDETPYSQGGKVVIRAMKKYGMILSDGGEIALTFADDRYSTAKWSSLGIEAQTFGALKPGDFEVVDLGAEIPLTFDCVRTP